MFSDTNTNNSLKTEKWCCSLTLCPPSSSSSSSHLLPVSASASLTSSTLTCCRQVCRPACRSERPRVKSRISDNVPVWKLYAILKMKAVSWTSSLLLFGLLQPQTSAALSHQHTHFCRETVLWTTTFSQWQQLAKRTQFPASTTLKKDPFESFSLQQELKFLLCQTPSHRLSSSSFSLIKNNYIYKIELPSAAAAKWTVPLKVLPNDFSRGESSEKEEEKKLRDIFESGCF